MFPSSFLAGVAIAAGASTLVRAGAGFTGKPVISGYWPSYASDLLTPAKIPYNKFTHIDWFIAETMETYELAFAGAEGNLSAVVEAAHAANVTVSLCIGGWSGSVFFSDLVANATSRQAYADSIKAYVDLYKLDGIDLDWEYPSVQGIGCNTIRPEADADNFLAFSKVLRETLGPDARLSAAVSLTGMKGADGEFYNRTGEIGNYLDYVTLMAYDVYGSWSETTGPLGPLYDTCTTEEGQGQSGATAVKLWTDAGFPAEKLLMGIPAYSNPLITKSSTLNFATNGDFSTMFYQEIDKEQLAPGGVTSAAAGTDVCGTATAAGPSWLFNELISTGRLTENGLSGANGYYRNFDRCSQTPFLFNAATREFIAYDGPHSFEVKAAFVRDNGMAGINMFDMTGDTTDSKLITAARTQLLGPEYA